MIVTPFTATAIVMCKARPPATLPPFDPSQGSKSAAQRANTNWAHRARINPYDATGHRCLRIVGVSAHKYAFTKAATINMTKDCGVSSPLAGFSPRLLVVPSDYTVIYGEDRPCIGNNPLSSFGGREAAKLDRSQLVYCSGYQQYDQKRTLTPKSPLNEYISRAKIRLGTV
jgi:hypothetical protein